MTIDNVSNAAPTLQFHRAAGQADIVGVARQRFVDTVVAVQRGNTSPITDDGSVRVVLTGGNTGTTSLSALTDGSGDIDWNRALAFFGDERLVAADSADRNALAVRERPSSPVGVPEGNIFEFTAADSGVTTTEVAGSYETTARKEAPNGFDLHLFGMGGEGHINSIFPHTAALAEQERLVVDMHNCPKLPPTRSTLTIPVIASSQHVWLLVTGGGKAEATTAIARQGDPVQWPAAGVRGAQETAVFVDDAVTAQLWIFASLANSPEATNPRQ